MRRILTRSMRDNYLVHGTNALKGALRYLNGDDYRYEPKSVSIYLSVACQTLSYLMEDKKTIEKSANGMSNTDTKQFNEFENLVEQFIKPDRALLIAADMDERMADYFFRNVEAMLENLNQRQDIKPKLLRERIKELRYSVCKSGLEEHIKEINLLWRSIKVVGGSAIIVTNYSAVPIISGLGSAFSQALGGYLASKGFDG